MPACGSVTQNITPECDNPMVAGVRDKLYLINFDDLDSVTRDPANNLLITDMLLGSGKVAYTHSGKNNSINAKFALVKKDFAEVYEHTVTELIFDNSPTVKEEIDGLPKGRFIAIVENSHRGDSGNSAFEIYGLDAGLVISVHTRDAGDDATQGAHSIELKSSAKSLEPHVPATFFDTSYAVTLAKVEALL